MKIFIECIAVSIHLPMSTAEISFGHDPFKKSRDRVPQREKVSEIVSYIIQLFLADIFINFLVFKKH